MDPQAASKDTECVDRESLLEEIPCIFCGRKNQQVVIEENGYQGRKCDQCEVIYVSPRPVPMSVVTRYTDVSAQDTAGATGRSVEKILRARHAISIIKRYVTSGSVLEIGCGAGHFLVEARRRGFEVYGVEPDARLASQIQVRLGIPCEAGVFRKSCFAATEFDVIYHCDVISHFADPLMEFETINERLRPGGLLVFETGNFAEVDRKYYSAIGMFQYPDHLFFFGERSLRELLRRTGFVVGRVYRYSTLWSLLLRRIIMQTLGRGRRSVQPAAITGGVATSNPCARGLLQKVRWPVRRWIQGALALWQHGACYGLGSVTERSHRPQTLIVVAKKRGQE